MGDCGRISSRWRKRELKALKVLVEMQMAAVLRQLGGCSGPQARTVSDS